jgi:hypothetical protein
MIEVYPVAIRLFPAGAIRPTAVLITVEFPTAVPPTLGA